MALEQCRRGDDRRCRRRLDKKERRVKIQSQEEREAMTNREGGEIKRENYGRSGGQDGEGAEHEGALGANSSK